VGVGEAVGLAVGVGAVVAVGTGVGVAVGIGVGVAVGVGDGVTETAGSGDAVGTGVAVTTASGSLLFREPSLRKMKNTPRPTRIKIRIINGANERFMVSPITS